MTINETHACSAGFGPDTYDVVLELAEPVTRFAPKGHVLEVTVDGADGADDAILSALEWADGLGDGRYVYVEHFTAHEMGDVFTMA